MTRKWLVSLLLWMAAFALAFYWKPIGGNQAQSSLPNETGAAGFSFPLGNSVLQVPFEVLANAIFDSAQANGKGPFLFAIDTGSWGSVFCQRTH